MMYSTGDPSTRIAASHLSRKNGFTLLELMVSVALSLILILGISQVFRITSETIGATQTLAVTVRSDRAAQSVFTSDLQSAVMEDAPCIIISSTIKLAFRNRVDEQSDVDQDVSTCDLGKTGTERQVALFDYNDRNHRTDIVNFFASNTFRRQTGDPGNYVSSTSSNEAWINYGYLRLYNGTGALWNVSDGPGGDGSYPSPGSGTSVANPTNYYASDWVVGRSQILLSELPTDRYFIKRDLDHASPLGTGSRSRSVSEEGRQYLIDDSRFDLAETSIALFRRQLLDRSINPPVPSPQDPNWWVKLTYPFCGSTRPIRPFDPAQITQTVPTFLPGCTQFIVEYAGDFLKQDQTTGSILGPKDGDGNWLHDGQIDFIVDSGIKRIRWYGLPRNVASRSADHTFHGKPDATLDAAGTPIITTADDVVPLMSLRVQPSDFEKIVPTAGAIDNWRYVCAWGPNELAKGSQERPLIFRITLILDDPAGRLNEGQVHEYVLKAGL